MANVDEILKKHEGRLSKDISEFKVGEVSKDYAQFKADMMPNLSRFEDWARKFGSLVRLNPNKGDYDKIQKHLNIAHLDISPSEVVSFSFFSAFLVFLLGVLIYSGVYFYSGILGGPNIIFLFMTFIASLFVFYYVYSSPARMANLWRL